MALVSQFCENITFERVNVVPRPGTIRTCPAWADCFHFSGCRGDILVDSCRFSGTQDDPINVHGTHLRLVERTGPNQVLVRFMHPQTYGIAAFQPGDQVEFVDHRTLRAYSANSVTGLQRKTDKEWLLDLTKPVAAFGKDDVVDNISWYPNITLRNCTVDTDSCRGFLITTRGKAMVEGCTFTRTQMSAILVEDDAEGWFESGPVRDLTIRNNKFIQCGQNGHPVIWLNPHNSDSDPSLPVHENIRILDNFFDGGGISAKSIKGLTITGNRFSAKTLPVTHTACTDVVIENNRLGE
jgi:polygalacturonase